MPVPHFERRVVVVRPEIRAEGDKAIEFSGHAALFNSLSGDLGGFVEQISPGAFKRTLRNKADVRFLINHNADLVLARSKSRTLELAEDDEGLAVRAVLPDTSYARDLVVSMERGDIDQMSFGFQKVLDTWDALEDGTPLRTLTEVKLFDVSVVTYPAYPETDANLLRSQQLDGLIRTLGLSDLDEAERDGLLTDIANYQITPDRLPTLIAARQALDSLIASAQTTVPTTGRSRADHLRFMQSLAKMHGLEL